MPGQSIPCLSTWYRHINAGDVGVRHGETPCHPNRKPKGPRPHPAMTVPGRLVLDDRPAGATNRSRFGHYEMDTVVSSTNGTGGLLVLAEALHREGPRDKPGGGHQGAQAPDAATRMATEDTRWPRRTYPTR